MGNANEECERICDQKERRLVRARTKSLVPKRFREIEEGNTGRE